MTSDQHLRALGHLIRQERVKRYSSMERAAEAGGLDQRTWRRIERGESVRFGSYEGIDRAFALEPGTTLGATGDAEQRAKLSRDLVATRPASSPRGSTEELLDEIRGLRRDIQLLAEAVRDMAERQGEASAELENGLVAVDQLALIGPTIEREVERSVR